MEPLARVDLSATQAGFHQFVLQQPLRAFLKPGEGGKSLTIYIEGDGARWQHGRPPRNPTPEEPMGFRLALLDPAESVAYLGRPCQYLDEQALSECSAELWTNARYGQKALGMLSEAIDVIKEAHSFKSIRLVGYSGGGTIAALLSARRTDVQCLVTVASPLDTTSWVKSLAISPLQNSMNPLDYQKSVVSLPQYHWMGGKDKIVPPSSNSAFMAKIDSPQQAVIDIYDHECCWVSNWPGLLQQTCLSE